MRARTVGEGVVAALLAVVVIAAAAAFGSDAATEADLRASTWVDDRGGARALHLLLGGLGLAPERAADPPDAAAPADRTLAVLAPSWPVTRAEADALLDWTAGGGRLVVAEGPSVPPAHVVDLSPVLTRLGLEARPASSLARDVVCTRPDWEADAPRVEWPAAFVLAAADAAARDPRAGEAETLASAAEGDVIVRVPFGEGEVVAVADASLFTNVHLRRADNAVLAVRVLAADGRRVAFDEFHHGFTPTGTRAGLAARLAGLLAGTWVGRALLVVALAGLVLVLGAAVRFGAPLAEPAPPRRAFREHADALGRLLEGAQASREALVVLLGGVRRRLAPRIGLGPRATPAEVRARLARSAAPGAAELADAVGAAAAAADAGGAKDVELARLAANLAAARRSFVRGGSER